jgi:hypothetical protein
MISRMSLRLLPAVAALVLGCGGGSMKVNKGEPQTAREKMLAEEHAKAKRGESIDDDVKPPGSKKWSGWRYQGDRDECFFLVGKKCFKSEKAACAAARCKAPQACRTEGAGPATLTCGKPR